MAGVIAAAIVVVGVGATYYSSVQSEQARKQSRAQNQAMLSAEKKKMEFEQNKAKQEQMVAESEARRERIKELRKSRMSRADIMASATARGAAMGSVVSGATATAEQGYAFNAAYSAGNVATRGQILQGAIANQQNIFSLTQRASMYGLKAQQYRDSAQTWGQIGSQLMSTGISMGGSAAASYMPKPKP